jgi:high-affinity nickel-transport protein
MLTDRATHPQAPSRLGAARAQLATAAHERHPLLGATAAVALLHLIGFGLLFLIVAPDHLHLTNGKAFGIGLGITAYTLGMRHAFDADHIAAIDNTSRKLLQEGRRPHASGLYFSAGHSTVVLVLAALVAAGVHGVGGAVGDERSALMTATGIWGPTISGLFLLTVGLVNLAVLRQSLRLMRRARRDGLDPAEVDRQLVGTGMLGRFTQRAAARVSSPWQLYPIGFMFGLGFDTASEIALLVLAGGGAANGLPVLAILALPILFAAGMTLLDTLNGAAMTKAYGWATHEPARRLAYNAAVTGTSVFFALVIGTMSLNGVLVDQLGIAHGPLATLASIDVGMLGFVLLGTILIAWAAAAAWWRTGERRASATAR